MIPISSLRLKEKELVGRVTVKQLLERLERIKDSLADSSERCEMEEIVGDIALLMDDVDSFGVDEDDLSEDY